MPSDTLFLIVMGTAWAAMVGLIWRQTKTLENVARANMRAQDRERADLIRMSQQAQEKMFARMDGNTYQVSRMHAQEAVDRNRENIAVERKATGAAAGIPLNDGEPSPCEEYEAV
jgi:hypothetical protein